MASIRPYDFGILLGLAYQDFVGALNRHLAELGFSEIGGSYGYVFRALAAEPLTTSELATRLRITPQGAAKIVEEMVGTGYVARAADPHDGRVKRLSLTERGRAALAAAREFHWSFEHSLARRHGATAVALMREVLTEIVERDPGAAEEANRLMRPM